MSHAFWLALYCVLILLASLAGGAIPMLVRLTHKRMELAVSFVAGVMLGVGLLHMLPHALMARAEIGHDHHDHSHAHAHNHAANGHAHEIDLHAVDLHDLIGPVMLWLIAGFLVMFFIERFFRYHHHDAPHEHVEGEDQHHEHTHAHEHPHVHDHHHHSPPTTLAPSRPAHGMTWAGAAIGLSLHSLIDGIALASSVEVARRGDGAAIAGLATFLVIFLHRPLDAMTIGTLMSISGRSMKMRHIVNFAFALLIPVGVVLFYAGLRGEADHGLITSSTLAFSAGTFLCIAMSDLLPELQFHQHDRVKLSAALLLGLALAWGVTLLEAQMH